MDKEHIPLILKLETVLDDLDDYFEDDIYDHETERNLIKEAKKLIYNYIHNDNDNKGTTN